MKKTKTSNRELRWGLSGFQCHWGHGFPCLHKLHVPWSSDGVWLCGWSTAKGGCCGVMVQKQDKDNAALRCWRVAPPLCACLVECLCNWPQEACHGGGPGRGTAITGPSWGRRACATAGQFNKPHLGPCEYLADREGLRGQRRQTRHTKLHLFC